MISFPNAKINLGLDIVGRRADGYHLLETLFLPIPLTDVLEVHPRPEGEQDRLTVYGGDLEGNPQDNLVLKAARALRTHFCVPPLDIYLKKQIPSGAGMGGGSSDASSMLTLLNEGLSLGATSELLSSLALGLGADCPFFIYNRPALGQGIGEVLTPIECLQLSGYRIVVVKPPLHIITAEAFRGLGKIAPKATPLAERLGLPLEQWREHIGNDFETSLFPLYPDLARIKAQLYDRGALYASMTGSGAALYGIFEPEHEIDIHFPSDYFIWQSDLL